MGVSTLAGRADLDGVGRTNDLADVLVHVGRRRQLRRRPGIEPSRLLLHPGEVIVVEGLQCTTLARALYDEMRLAPSLAEAVAVVDAGVSRITREPRTSLQSVEVLVHGKHKTRGLRQAHAALALATERAGSRGETRLRLNGWDVGLRSLLVNAPVFDPDGRLVAVVHLLDEESALVLEYDGADHRQPKRHTADNVREEDLEELNLVVVRAGNLDLRTRPQLLRRLRSGHSRGLRRDVRQDRWTTTPPAGWYGSWHEARWGVPPWR